MGMTTRKIFPPSFYNPISLAGAVIFFFNLGLMIFLAVVAMLAEHPKPYADLIIFVALPMIICLGAVLIVVGALRERRRLRAGGILEQRLPVVDFNNPRHRVLIVILGGGFVVLSLLYAFAGFKTYEYTESDTFCGVLCHGGGQSIHRIENASYSFSHHAKIGCSTCHVGSGAKYFVLYKLRGMRQFLNMITGRIPRPIPTPLVDLRPAHEVCESCHGPKYRFYERLEERKYFLSDRDNTQWGADLLLKMGTAGIKTGRPPKLHWHSSTTEEIIYDASDPKREVIPWIYVKRLDGKERTYRSRGAATSIPEPKASAKRRMDCVDCHNRTGHIFRNPSDTLNVLLSTGLVDPALPEIKKTAVKALDAEYPTFAAGKEGIEKTISDFYHTRYPRIAETEKGAIDHAVAALQRAYENNYDPFMKASWRTFPDNRGHLHSLGCFRCHDGNHVSDDGAVLSKDCTSCHLLLRHQVIEKKEEKSAEIRVLSYPHPVDIGDSYRTMNCSDCHGAAK
jgi:hypothetical protein